MGSKHWSQADKDRSVAAYIAEGTFRQAAKLCKIPHQTIAQWHREEPEWWNGLAAELYDRHEDERRAGLGDIIRLGIREALDRLENGDEVFNKAGELVRRKMSGRDVSTITGTMYDKIMLSLGRPKSIKGREELTTGDKLAELKKVAASVMPTDVQPIPVVKQPASGSPVLTH